jgi:hypothetical protein
MTPRAVLDAGRALQPRALCVLHDGELDAVFRAMLRALADEMPLVGSSDTLHAWIIALADNDHGG